MGLSVLGKINILKKMVVPQINYVTYLLPMSFPLSLPKRFNVVVDFFVWWGKIPSLNRIKVCVAKEDGGLNLPRVDWDHFASSLNHLTKIIQPGSQWKMNSPIQFHYRPLLHKLGVKLQLGTQC